MTPSGYGTCVQLDTKTPNFDDCRGETFAPTLNKLGGGMMLKISRFCAAAAITSLLAVAALISATHFDLAQAQSKKTAQACGQEMLKHCSGVPVQANNMLECVRKEQGGFSKRCVALANTVARRCERDAAQRCQGVVAGQGNVLQCLTTARRSVSRRCNAALDAVFLR